MPSLEAFPKSQQVTVRYYEGVLDFLEEHYEKVQPSIVHTEVLLADLD